VYEEEFTPQPKKGGMVAEHIERFARGTQEQYFSEVKQYATEDPDLKKG
jgi:hypothetical protein